MNRLQHFNEIEILFDNCEVVRVETDAIKDLDFHVSGQRYRLENAGLDYTTEVDVFRILLDLSNPEWYTAYSNQKEFVGDPMKRLAESNDISRFYINGTSFSVPWHREYRNDWQRNFDFAPSSDGHKRILIEIRQAEQ